MGGNIGLSQVISHPALMLQGYQTGQQPLWGFLQVCLVDYMLHISQGSVCRCLRLCRFQSQHGLTQLVYSEFAVEMKQELGNLMSGYRLKRGLFVVPSKSLTMVAVPVDIGGNTGPHWDHSRK